jgi:hypothetical protein
MGLQMRIRAATVLIFLTVFVSAAAGQSSPASSPMQLYESLQKFQLAGATSVHNLVLQRDRGEITFADGTIYFQAPIDGHVYSAVFIGTGKFHADAPPIKFEQDNLRRLIHSVAVDSDFHSAVLRFTDDTYEIMGKGSAPGIAAPADAVKLAEAYDDRMSDGAGANISERLAESILNHESPGFFVAEFSRGSLGRFSFLWDPQTRIPSEIFGINGGEKGLILYYEPVVRRYYNWMAFYPQENYPDVPREFPDAYDQIKIQSHDIAIDLRHPGDEFRYNDRMTMDVEQDGLRVVQFAVNRDLKAEFANVDQFPNRIRLASVETEDGQRLEAVQELNDKTVVVFLPEAAKRGQRITIQMGFEAVKSHDYRGGPSGFPNNWYPRHGYRQRATFRVRFIHSKRYVAIGLGEQISETPWSKDHSYLETEWQTDSPLASYGYELFDRYRDHCKELNLEVKTNEATFPVKLYGECSAGRTKYIQGEIQNALEYFDDLYGPYPYSTLGPYTGGALTFMADRATFIGFGGAMAFEWWGRNITARSYRDQWMIDGLRNYSALLYERHRGGDANFRYILHSKREELGYGSVTIKGAASGRMADLGPIILGRRLGATEFPNVFGELVIQKGALIFRMLDFLFTEPVTQDDKEFWAMLREFEEDHGGDAASTEDLIAVANKNFANTAIARQFNLKDLDWFFDYWVYGTGFPSYRLVYHLEPQPDGSAMVKGNLFQEGLAEDAKWFMPLPVTVSFGKGTVEHYILATTGRQTEVSFKVSATPDKVELDPELFVISSRTSTQKER